jgi:hypothetical protein
LVADYYHGNPMLSMEHHQAWLSQVVPRGVGVRYVKICAEGVPVGYFPLLQDRTFHLIPARRLSFPRMLHTGPILDGRWAHALLRYFHDGVLPGLKWDVLEWCRASPEYLPVETLIEGFRKTGHLIARQAEVPNWIYAGENNGFQAYCSSRGAATRYEIRRLARRFNRNPGTYEIRIFRNQEGLNAIPDYDLVFSRSWKNAEPNPVYIRELVRQLGALGQIRLAFLVLNGRPVATQLWLCANGRAYAHTVAYDDKCPERSPGTFLLTRMLESAIDDDRVSRIDFLQGDEPYKKQFADRRHVLHNFLVFPPTALGRALYTLDQRVLPFVLSNRPLSTVAAFALRGSHATRSAIVE